MGSAESGIGAKKPSSLHSAPPFCANLAADAANLTADTRDVSNPKFHPDFAQHRAGRNAAKNRDTPAKRTNNGVGKQDFQAGAKPVRQIHLLPGNSMAENLSISI